MLSYSRFLLFKELTCICWTCVPCPYPCFLGDDVVGWEVRDCTVVMRILGRREEKQTNKRSTHGDLNKN